MHLGDMGLDLQPCVMIQYTCTKFHSKSSSCFPDDVAYKTSTKKKAQFRSNAYHSYWAWPRTFRYDPTYMCKVSKQALQ